MTVQHPDYEHEQKRLDETRSIIQKEVDTLRKEVKEITDDYVKQVVNYKKGKELRYLEDQGLEKPYFGRVDFLKDETYELDSVYIGKRGIVRSDTFDSIVVDWRAPIASLYYSGESKDAYFRSGREIVRGEVRLKRNFAIEDGKITGIYDGALKETIHREVGHPDEFLQEGYIDEFLAANLNQTNDSRLKDIVATIQSEQNDIIRADKDRPVVVQGVAGSGKTTIALHRLSYLIYNYQDSMMSKRFMVFAPNRLFLTYISEVLPELGVDDVQQATFLDWASKLVKSILPKGWRILDPHKPLQLFFEQGQSDAERRTVLHRLRFKGSLAFRDVLQQYLLFVAENRVAYKKLSFVYNRTKHVFTIPGETIRQLFAEQYAHLPYRRRMEAVRKHVKQDINKQLFAHLREKRIDLDKQALAKYEKMIDQLLDKYFSIFPELDVFSSYREMLTDTALLKELTKGEVNGEDIEDICRSSAEIFEAERIEPEDIAPLIYLRHLIEGLEQADHFDHSVVDEAQDLSALEIAVIGLVTKRHSLTVVGDIAQGIHAYRGLQSWEELLEGVFQQPRGVYYTLAQSYRSTIEIMKCANEVLRKINLPETIMAKPVLRHGEKPLLASWDGKELPVKNLVQLVNDYRQEGFQSIAIVAKTAEASKKAYKSLKASIEGLKLLGSKDTQFPGGVVVMPAYLTKGLQFDVVILLNIEEYLDNEWDTKLLYVAMTRPVHRLFMIHQEDRMSPLFADVPPELYEKRSL
ncbi:AAA family ATPase [Brevibacillus borstelensis]|jgi:DNA helicase II / ATP-dependent DNA helicase PcrA|uniref:HelD family protein n=1 Tax=Brevibacillus borstelensis TaxID=45462 RepID=UPI00148F54E7|nr:UvrD-helicase domain-containing protein [Brevibacillus borstelensis]MCC0563689.1 AAA family ATPase [Brevibacillus borstelensis]MCM3469612.1 AAA family ATPase [Brevibacillus borstelensis]MCM3559307.1 AAA family ATPase [Brevibacillus borstelensis]MCM3589256.1 AAA family ATPase [Brevibacillus borstelensis]MCM3625540.1 AAA family ATPase [Brevibacillus borstelensis]